MSQLLSIHNETQKSIVKRGEISLLARATHSQKLHITVYKDQLCHWAWLKIQRFITVTFTHVSIQFRDCSLQSSVLLCLSVSCVISGRDAESIIFSFNSLIDSDNDISDNDQQRCTHSLFLSNLYSTSQSHWLGTIHHVDKGLVSTSRRLEAQESAYLTSTVSMRSNIMDSWRSHLSCSSNAVSTWSSDGCNIARFTLLLRA